MASNTQTNIGVRRLIKPLFGQFATPQFRNYEPHGGQLYLVVRPSLQWAGTTYARGATIPYDASFGTRYSNDALMEIVFNQAWVDPAS
jgi:hypothetical protein